MMATSSITKNFVITGESKVEAFADAIEKSANTYTPRRQVSARQLSEPDEIRNLMSQVKRKKTNA